MAGWLVELALMQKSKPEKRNAQCLEEDQAQCLEEDRTFNMTSADNRPKRIAELMLYHVKPLYDALPTAEKKQVRAILAKKKGYAAKTNLCSDLCR